MVIMGRLRHINLEDIPWPISILKFNQVVSEMKPGDHMIAFLKDVDVMNNLLQLMRHQPDLGVTTSTSGNDFYIEVKRQRIATHEGATTTSQKDR
jgi:hypothetical protein